jgi:hypothetical protein
MKRRRLENDLSLSLRFIADWEGRVLRQKQLISRLEEQQKPTGPAELVLKGFERTLQQLQNHSEIMQKLMKE